MLAICSLLSLDDGFISDARNRENWCTRCSLFEKKKNARSWSASFLLYVLLGIIKFAAIKHILCALGLDTHTVRVQWKKKIKA